MLFGVQVFSRAKVVPDLALSRGEEAHRHARLLGDRSLEFAAANGLALTHLELGEVDEAEQWLDRAAEAAAVDPTPLRARQLESARGMIRAAAGDAEGMREAPRAGSSTGYGAGSARGAVRGALQACAGGGGSRRRARRRGAARARRTISEGRQGAYGRPARPPALGGRGGLCTRSRGSRARGAGRRRPRRRDRPSGRSAMPTARTCFSPSSCRPRVSFSSRVPRKSARWSGSG